MCGAGPADEAAPARCTAPAPPRAVDQERFRLRRRPVWRPPRRPGRPAFAVARHHRVQPDGLHRLYPQRLSRPRGRSRPSREAAATDRVRRGRGRHRGRARRHLVRGGLGRRAGRQPARPAPGRRLFCDQRLLLAGAQAPAGGGRLLHRRRVHAADSCGHHRHRHSAVRLAAAHRHVRDAVSRLFQAPCRVGRRGRRQRNEACPG